MNKRMILVATLVSVLLGAGGYTWSRMHARNYG